VGPFILVGNDCPYGRYPAPVIPVVSHDGRLAAIYHGNGELAQIVYLDPSCTFNKHSKDLQKRLAAFNQETDRLFAFTRTDVRFYDAKVEQEFFQEFLLDPDWKNCDPFMRLMLARLVGAPLHIRPEVDACFQILKGTAPNTAAAWYQNELAGIAKCEAQRRKHHTQRDQRVPWAIDRRMLIVEDQPDFGDVLADKFRINGFHVSIARDGIQAIKQVEREQPEIVLLDLMLPLLSGYEVLQYIRRNETTCEIPVLCVSAFPEASHGEAAMKLGASRYLTKSAGLPNITRAVRGLVLAGA